MSSLISSYQTKFGADLQKWIASDLGSATLRVATQNRPSISCGKTEQETIYRAGQVDGYEMAIKNIIALSIISDSVRQPEANYGVNKETDSKASS